MTSPNPIRYTSIWHEKPELEVILRQCVAENRSAGVAGEKLSKAAGQYISRCAAMSKASRLGLKFKSVKHNRKPKKYDRVTGRQQFRKDYTTPTLHREPIMPPTEVTGMLGLELWQLQSDQCRWPDGDHAPYKFCALPTVEGASWCEGHCAVVFARPPVAIKRYSPSMPRF